MRVFVTGATGFIGMALVKNLVAAGHSPVGLCRAPDKAEALSAAGAKVVLGTVQDEALLAREADAANAVVHLAFNHDFSKFAANCEDDQRVIRVLGEALAGSHKPLVVTSGTALAQSSGGAPAKESSPPIDPAHHPRALSETTATSFAAKGVHVSIMRLPQVHDTRRQGLVSPAIQLFLEKKTCAYVGDGSARWAAAHVSDVAPLYRLAVEKAAPLATYHAVDEEGVTMREVVETLGQRLNLPVRGLSAEETPGFFGWMAMFAALDMPASGAWTQATLDWRPKGPGLIADLKNLKLD